MRLRRARLFLLVIAAGATVQLVAADQGLPAQSPLTPQAPVPSLVAYAADHHIPLEGIALSPEGSASRKGDQVVLLFALEKDGAIQQWLVRLQADELDRKEQGTKPSEEIIYTSTGHVLRYTSTPTALEVEFIGPFQTVAGGPAVAVGKGRALVGREYLDLGMAEYCRTSLGVAARLRAAGITVPYYTAGSDARSTADIARGREAAAAFGLTPEEERLATSVYFAVRSFFAAAMEIPACQDVLEQVIQKPSVWSVVSQLGVSTFFNYGWQKVQTVPGGIAGVDAPVYLLPLSLLLNNKPGVHATLAVTEPRPPLQACAGILAICAEHPTIPERRLFIRVLSARRAGE